MGWTPNIQVVRKKGRKPYYRIRCKGKEHHLGTDKAEAYRRASLILQDNYDASTEPVSVNGLAMLWAEHHPGKFYWEMLQPWLKRNGQTLLEDIEPDHLEVLLEDLGKEDYSPWSIQKFIRYPAKVLRWARGKGLIGGPEHVVPKLPKAASKVRDVPLETLEKTFATLPPHASRVCRFMLATGCRPSEAVNLTWDELDLDKGVAVVEKHKTVRHGRVRSLYLTEDGISILRDLGPKDSGPVFLNSRGDPYTVNGLSSILRRHGISGIYRLRHTFAQHALDAGVPMEDVAKLLGHVDLQTVQTYAQVRDQRVLRVARTLPSVLQTSPAEPVDSPDGGAPDSETSPPQTS